MVAAAPGGNPAGAARFEALDSLRGVAALAVAAEHLNAQGPVFGHAFFRSGWLFVDFFFVLSGFVIAAAYGERLRSGFPALRFLWLRVGRIWPMHIVVLIAYLAIELIALVQDGSGLTGREAFAPERAVSALLVQALLLQALYTPAMYAWSLQSWSVAVEMVIYAFAAIGWRALGRWWWLAGVVFALGAGVLMEFPQQVGLYHKLLRGLCGFGLGAGAFAAWRRLKRRLAAAPRAVMTLAEIALCLGVFTMVAGFGDTIPMLVCDGLFALAVLVFAAERGRVSGLLLTPPLMLGGLLSYSLYMVHPLVESLTMTGLRRIAALAGWGDAFIPVAGNNRPAIGAGYGLLADGAALIALACALAAAWAGHRLIEKPARDWSRRIAPRIG